MPSLAGRRPVTVFVTIALATSWVLLSVPAIVGLPPEPFLLVTCYAGLMGTALVLTRLIRGPGAIRELLRGVLRWRFGGLRWVTILVAMPVLTLGVAALSGTLRAPDHGWPILIVSYLAQVLLLGALLFNIPEEIGWSGFVQSRLMDRYGLFGGAMRTAPLFVAIHLPLLFQAGNTSASPGTSSSAGWTWSDVAISAAALTIAAPFFRYLLGMLYLDTGASLLAVGVQHAAFNGSGSLSAVDGGWQYIPAMIALTLILALIRSRRPTTVDTPTPALVA
jgi:uncharacterized protein